MGHHGVQLSREIDKTHSGVDDQHHSRLLRQKAWTKVPDPVSWLADVIHMWPPCQRFRKNLNIE